MLEIEGIRLGFFCSTQDGKVTTNRKFHLKNLTFERVMEAFEKNLRDFELLLDLSLSLGCGVFRLGSDMVPFASHPNFKREWLRPIEEALVGFSRRLKDYPIRITMHPGQFVVLSSPKEQVLSASLRELEYHFWLLDRLGVGREGVVVVHVGGLFEGKEGALKRFKKVLKEQGWLTERLVVENDERHYTVEDLLRAELPIPIVYDHYHHTLNPSNFQPDEVLSTWGDRVPEFHLSSKPEGRHRFGEHGEWVKREDFLVFLRLFGGRRVDLILEAKAKEKALQRLLTEIKSIGL
ncbi:MAG: UV DNA damage repair endonuclease UvsE [Aquificaceae bacterium]|nr:UV DNA damage repair endonuclease UvsE [Aquificaceae bacterium]MCX8059590.1 UV DNA damage repair endonuclease UvsE [Aquificaceae bacterium]MDW8096732.1 UV DNA damage repair endonuclease UvsE [Aquificaceae bacterium]